MSESCLLTHTCWLHHRWRRFVSPRFLQFAGCLMRTTESSRKGKRAERDILTSSIFYFVAVDYCKWYEFIEIFLWPNVQAEIIQISELEKRCLHDIAVSLRNIRHFMCKVFFPNYVAIDDEDYPWGLRKRHVLKSYIIMQLLQPQHACHSAGRRFECILI